MAADDESLEELLSRCLDAHARGGEPALELALSRYPEHAARLRRRIEDLERFGLLGAEERHSSPDRIGPYRVLARLGRGGMGEVFLGEDERDGTRVAVKLARVPIDDGSGDGGHMRERFAREVRAVAALDHPDVVAIHESGEHEGRPWYAMDYVEGATVAAVLARLRALPLGPEALTAEHVHEALALEDAERAGASIELGADTYVEWVCRVVARVARAVDHAHAQGIVHRDLKPSNVLIRPDGRALLFDLGLAHVVDDPGLTRSGDVAGTPAYLAPEQAEGRRGAIDARTDVWGLGVTLYEMLTLRRPFEGDGAPSILRAVVERDPPAPRDLNAELPRDLENVCSMALEKDPRKRYPSASALADDLERLLCLRPVSARPVGWMRRTARRVRRRPALGVALALTALVLVGAPVGLLSANAAIRAQARNAERAAVDALAQSNARERVVDHLVDLFRSERAAVDPEVLDDTVNRVLGGAGEDALTRASLLEATGRVFHNMGQHARALPLLDRAFALRKNELADRGGASVELLVTLSEVHLAHGRAETALTLAERALDATARPGSDAGARLFDVRIACARAARSGGDLGAAEAHLEAAGALGARERGDLEQRARLAEESARLRADAGDLRAADGWLARAIELRERTWMPDASALAALHAERARVLRRGDGLDFSESARDADERARSLRAALATAPGSPAPALDLEPTWLAEYEATFQTGVTALQANEPAVAVASFERCLVLRPRSGVCAYNIACGYALAGELESAWPWLEQAVRWDFARTPAGRAALENDLDLAPLRASRRFDALLAAEEARQEAGTPPVVREPRAVGGGWLVLVHDNGTDPGATLDGPWGDAAAALGLGVFAPRAPRPAADEPGGGFDWFEHLSFFARAPWTTEDELLAPLQCFARDRVDVADRARLAGEGAGAAVAFDLALRAPGRWSGVLLVNSPLLLEGNERLLQLAAALDLRVRLLLDADLSVPGWPTAAAYAAALRSWAEGEGLDRAITIEVRERPGSAEAYLAELREQLELLGR